MSDLATLIIERDRIKAKLNRVKDFVAAFEEGDDLQQLQLRKNDLQTVYKNFDKIQAAIEPLSTSRELAKLVASEWISFETNYYNIVADICKRIKVPASSDVSASTTHQPEITVKLPDLNLPSFSGSYADWTSFYDTFETLINRRSDLNECQKFHYLKSCLKGDAFRTVKALTISSANYNAALQLLKKRYQNTRLIVHEHVTSILGIQKMSKVSNHSLRQLINEVNSNLEALRILNLPVNQWDALLVLILTEKLDYNTNRDWQTKLNSHIPKLNKLLEFLEQKCITLESLEGFNKFSNCKTLNSAKPFRNLNNRSVTMTHVQINNKGCYFCKNVSHNIYKCNQFANLSYSQKMENLDNLKLCKNCLRSKHGAADCKSTTKCKYCNQDHHSLLHKAEPPASSSHTETVTFGNVSTYNLNNKTHNNAPQGQVLLSTALVYIKDSKGTFHECRALLDVGSQANIITESLAKRLNLDLKNNTTTVQGINQKSIVASKSAMVNIRSRTTSFSQEFSCLVLPQITGLIPSHQIQSSELTIPNNINLADPKFSYPGTVELLIGAGLFWSLLGPGKEKTSSGNLCFIETYLGWIVGGELKTGPRKTTCNVAINIEKQLEGFWEIKEGYNANKANWSKGEDLCETLFINTYKRDCQGRFIVKLPFTLPQPEVGSSKQIALKRLQSLQNKFKREPAFKEDYCKFMKEYISLGHMELVPNELNSNNPGCYLPHHGIVKQSNNKLRVVFDASAKTTNGNSLNDMLLTGPTLQQDLISILIRFRTFPIAFCGDITKMYRQIKVDTQDANYQKILWQEDPNKAVQTYRLLTVTYGTTCAPFLAVRCLQQAALDAKDNFPNASNIILRDFYMDDLLTGAASVSEALELQGQITEILKGAGFELSKWASNSSALGLNQSTGNSIVDLNWDENIKTLGVIWDYKNDYLTYTVNPSSSKANCTKRSMLSVIAQIFDPLGLVSPMVVKAKILLQKLWSLKMTWDQILPDHLHHMWTQFMEELIYVNKIQIKRCAMSMFPAIRIEIHGFCDSSQYTYGAAIYIRSQDSYNNYGVHLLCSKSRVAPLKTLSIPRLELCGGLLLARLMHKVVPVLNVNYQEKFYWTDSSIVLHWLSAPPNTWNIFVANRVAEIQGLSNIREWGHINSKYNPADIISRGASPMQLIDNSLWWQGPEWLSSQKSDWPRSSLELNVQNIPETRKISPKLLVTEFRKNDLLLRYSTFSTLQRVLAFVFRFAYNCKNKNAKRTGSLTVQELGFIEILVVKLVQAETFAPELLSLTANKYVTRQSNLYLLNPMINKDGIIRVGGRIKNSFIASDKKFPIILPAKHHVTRLLILREHERQLHAGVQATLTGMRQRYWIISGRNVIRLLLNKCLRCFKSQPKPGIQKMGDLPTARLEPSRPFLKTGVDYIGPILIREGSMRGRPRKVKAYIALFICFATKCVHLELVGNLTSDSFLGALRRFISRRGHVSDIYSDNATNFKGADKELQRFFGLQNFQNVIDKLTPINVSWHFIPPRSPTFGGLWEANVKLVKRHLKIIVKDANINFEEMSTILARIEACLNSRPICPISNDPNDLSVLTPGHFLIGEPLLAPVEPDLTGLSKNRLSRWQYMEQIRQHFWRRWQREYLTSLQQRSKWNQPPVDIKLGTMVLVNEDNVPPQQWLLGRIIQLHPGRDGITRVVSIKTSMGVKKRAINRLSPLPVEQ